MGRDQFIVWDEAAEAFCRQKKIFLDYPWKTAGILQPGSKVRIPADAVIEPYANLAQGRFMSLGAFSYVRSTELPPEFRCGRYCSIAPKVRISDQEHPLTRVTTHPFTLHKHCAELAEREFGKTIRRLPFEMKNPPPVIGHDVWLGRDCIIKRGVTVGHGAVVAERAVVTKDVPPYAIVGGIPAQIIRFRFPEEIIQQLLELAWWDYNFADFGDMDMSDVRTFIRDFSRTVKNRTIRPFRPDPIHVAEELPAYLAEAARPKPAASARRTIAREQVVISAAREPETFQEFLHLRFSKVDPYDTGKKLAVSKMVQALGFEMPKIYQVWSDPKDIKISSLPEEFVLKPANLAGKRGVYILHRISGEHGYWDSISQKRVWRKDLVREYLKWQEICKETRRKDFSVIAEEYVPGRPHNKIPLDYKFYTFNGVIRLIIQIDRNGEKPAMAFYDRDFSPIDTTPLLTPNPEQVAPAAPVVPDAAERMLAIASEISARLQTPFISIDMYDAPRGPLIGELTQSPGGPYYARLFKLTPSYDRELGALWREAARKLGTPIYRLKEGDRIPRTLSKGLPRTV